MSETVLFNHILALTELKCAYVPLPDPGPPNTKNTSAGAGASTWCSWSLTFKSS